MELIKLYDAMTAESGSVDEPTAFDLGLWAVPGFPVPGAKKTTDLRLELRESHQQSKKNIGNSLEPCRPPWFPYPLP